MSPSLYTRLLAFAYANHHRPKWKARLYALLYGASLKVLNKIGREK